jgi:peptidoglycan/LPS O-acetylase OafA/YrhL
MAAKQDIPALTGLRGAAALWVAVYHLLLPAKFVTGPAATMLGRGYLAVDLFFVLSGFVMALTYGPLFRPGLPQGENAFGAFMLRRLARLYPLYGSILAVRFTYTWLRYGTFDLPRPWIAAPLADPAWSIPVNLMMMQSWGLAGSSIGTAWSISTEWGAYFLFPALAAAVIWRGKLWAAAMMVAAAFLILAVALLDQGSGYHAGVLDAWDGLTTGPAMRCLAGFILGMGVWRLSQHRRVAQSAGSYWCLGGVLILLALCIATGASDLTIYPLFPLLVLSLACLRARTVFQSPVLLWLGEISYALYLLHIFMLHPLDVTRACARLALPVWAADIAAPALIFAVLLAASHASYRLLENPGRAAIMRWGGKLLHPRQGTASVANLTPNT